MKTIIFDIGHANGTGARGNGAEEHAVATDFVADLAARAAAANLPAVRVVDFPTLTNAGDLAATIRAANAGHTPLFGVSFHLDSAAAPAARGGHVCWYSEKGRELAEAIAAYLAPVMPGRAEITVQRKNLAILKQTRAPWVLIELGFITNVGDLAKMRDNPATPQDERAALIRAIINGLHAAVATAENWDK